LETRGLAGRIGFDNAFVFRYSPRAGTTAAGMDGQIPEDVKEARNRDLLEVVNRHVAEKLGALVGCEVEILCEGPSRHNPARLSGRTRTNKIVVFEGGPEHAGRLVRTQVVRASASTLYGVLPGAEGAGPEGASDSV
jgi:tRNA-2-methylthio-N6-dimethylallyladenosine synthase